METDTGLLTDAKSLAVSIGVLKAIKDWNLEPQYGYPLGLWVCHQRQRQAKNKMSLDRRKRLEMSPGWSWNVLSDRWEHGFSYLKEFAEREGHCRAPRSYKTKDGFRLGEWVSNRRKNKDTMDPHRRQRLEALPGWSWDARSDPKWEPQDCAVSVISSEEEVIL